MAGPRWAPHDLPVNGAAGLTLARQDLDRLLGALRERGHITVGPIVHDGAIGYDEIRSTADLPAGWTDDQRPGHYRLVRREDDALFGYVVGPQSWKKFLSPPLVTLWTARREGSAFRVEADATPPPRYAFVGVRACEIAAIARQDKVFLEGPHRDPVYAARRDRVFLIAVGCGGAASTCFCTSMGTGPRIDRGFDIALTEVLEGQPYYVARAGSDRGAGVLTRLGVRASTPEELAAAERAVVRGEGSVTRRMDADGLPALLGKTLEHPRWDHVAARCLACASCTMVCPTCFCTTVEDVNDLAGTSAERVRRWDSCFTPDYSYIHGGSVRPSTRSRYRQWLTHKLGTWHEQLGTSGCVGCGRCITWCPPGIDLTEEVRALRGPAKEGSRASPHA